MEFLLTTNCLTKQYKNQIAVDNVSLHLKRGEIYGIIGRNGAGKTTFLKMISGLSHPTSGEICLFGYKGRNMSKALPRIGVLIDEPGFYSDISAYENLKLKCICLGIRKSGYIEGILDTVGLPDVGKKKVKNFSFGMKQRLGIGMALVGEPDLLILDEPIKGLDPEGIAHTRDMLLKLNKDKNITIIISSHILEELSKIATVYGIIHKGRLMQELTRDELMKICSEWIEIKLDYPNLALTVLDQMGFTKYKVIDNQTIHIYERLNESGDIIMALTKEDVRINTITITNQTVEEYFLKLTEAEY